MKIKPVHTDDPLARNKRSAALKPLAGEDFHGTLAALTPTAPAQPTATVAPSPDAALTPQLQPLSADPMIRNFKGQPRPLDPLKPAGAPPLVPLAESDEDFAPGLPRHNAPDAQDKVTETARKLVAQTFYGTLLKQMRNSPFKSELFEGGRGGQAFSPLLDQHLAEHMTRATDNHLVNAIARKLQGKAAYQRQYQLSAAKRSAARITPNLRTPNVAPSLRA
jgi:Rod binding domain-containing protein